MGVILSYFEQPWRDVKTDYQNNQDFLKSYKPRNQRVKHLRILLHGPVGAGKSSFINSVESALRGRVADSAQTDANSGTSFTKKYAAHKIPKDDGSCYGFIFNDIMGLEEKTNKGVKVEDLELTLKGHVSDGYQFNPEVQLKANDKDYNSHPSLEDRVHVLVSVIPADSVSILSDGVVKKMREVRMTASEMGIPQLAILTKVDKLEPNMGKVYTNQDLKEQVDKFSLLLGLPIKCIFLVKNYHEEIKTNDDMTAQILSAVKQMICFGEDFVNRQSTSCT
ncbi:interferon-induced protein 44-like isoform X2 [Pungitius pungitius]|uniref:interferon-induced protein 44-like isoform X2 n=1 Tax=Pungitius pungitius TaxID=134920 RepID=UPI002E149693